MKTQTIREITGTLPRGWGDFANQIYSGFSWCDIKSGEVHSCKEQASYYLRKNHDKTARSYLAFRVPNIYVDPEGLVRIRRRIEILGWDMVVHQTNYANVLVLDASYEDAQHMAKNSYILAYIRQYLGQGNNKADAEALSLSKSKEVKKLTSIPLSQMAKFSNMIESSGAYYRSPNGIVQYLKAVKAARAKGLTKVLDFLE